MTVPLTALPAGFDDLDVYTGWALATETERNHKRIDSSQADIEAFANAMLPRVDAICGYLDAYPLDTMPDDARRLYFMLLSVAEVAPSVEGYNAPRVPYGFDSSRFQAQEDFPLRPRF
jgi:hypothetical protein